MIRIIAFFFSQEDLLGRFRRLPRDAFTIFYIASLGSISLGWFRRYGRNLLPMLQSDFVIHKNLLWCFVFIVFVLCLVTTFIGRLLYFLLPTLRSDFYCILFYNDLFADVKIGLPRWSSSWRTRLINRVLRPIRFINRVLWSIFLLLQLHRMSRQWTVATCGEAAEAL